MVERIRELCKQRGTSITKLEQSLGFGNGVIGRWNKSKPSYDRVEKVASALGVPVAYITGETAENEKPATVAGDELSENKKFIIEMLPKLSDAQAKMFRAVIEQVLAEDLK